MTDTWPPSAETLETWAFVVDAVNEPEYTTPELAAFLRDPRLREALELAEEQRALVSAALSWWEGHRPVEWSEAEHLGNPAVNAHGSERSRDLAESAGAYVRALRAKIEKEGV